MLMIKFKNYKDVLRFTTDKMGLLSSPTHYYDVKFGNYWLLIIPCKNFLENCIFDNDYIKYKILDSIILDDLDYENIPFYKKILKEFKDAK